eukprot:2372663-Amphidinium_carterae.3
MHRRLQMSWAAMKVQKGCSRTTTAIPTLDGVTLSKAAGQVPDILHSNDLWDAIKALYTL